MSNKNKGKNGVVYSTNPDFVYESEQESDTLAPEQQRLYVRREVRNGKPCVVVKDFIGRLMISKLWRKSSKITLEPVVHRKMAIF